MKNEAKKTLNRFGKTFYFAGMFLPKKIFKDAAVIYYVCRKLDDSIDNPKIKYDNLEIENEFKKLNINKDIYSELNKGVLSDSNFNQFNDESELLNYCYQVAGTVGLMMNKILHTKNLESNFFAIDLGIAMQLTNILRDIYEDYKSERIYIPKAYGVTLKDINEIKKNKIILENSIIKLFNLSEKYYKSALIGIKYIPFRSRLAIYIALKLYRYIGIKVVKSFPISVKKRVFINLFQKILFSIFFLFEFFLYHNFKVIKKHDKKLHINISQKAYANR